MAQQVIVGPGFAVDAGHRLQLVQRREQKSAVLAVGTLPVVDAAPGDPAELRVDPDFLARPRVEGHDAANAIVTTLAEEKRFNTFLRLTSPSVIAKLRETFPDLPEKPDAKTVFLRLRELRNRW